MKRRYQIDQQRAVQQFRQLAREENPHVQMIFPMAEVVGLLQEGVGHLLREAGLCDPCFEGRERKVRTPEQRQAVIDRLAAARRDRTAIQGTGLAV